jgi:hypothetical protein
MVKVRKAKGQGGNDDYRNNYLENQKLVKKKSIREIYFVSCKLADMELAERNWKNDPRYTRFFKSGGMCFSDLVKKLGNP